MVLKLSGDLTEVQSLREHFPKTGTRQTGTARTGLDRRPKPIPFPVCARRRTPAGRWWILRGQASTGTPRHRPGLLTPTAPGLPVGRL